MAKKNNIVPSDKESGTSEIIRKFKASPGLYIGSVIILVLVVVTFVGGDLLSGGGFRRGASSEMTFGYYDKVPIAWVPGNYFAQYYEQILRYYRGSIDVNDYQYGISIWRQAYEGAAVHTAILQEMKRSNYFVPEKTVDRNVAQLSQFQENGRFSSALYRSMSESERLILWRQVQDEIIKNQYYSDLFSLQISGSEAEFFGKMSASMRSFDLVSFSVDDFPDSEYAAYARQNSDHFRNIHLSRISVSSSEREARRILDSIKNGVTTFEDAARSQSVDGFNDRSGDMGIRYTYELDSEITNASDREAIFKLRKGELSDVFNVGGLWVFFRVEDEIKYPDFDDATVLSRVRSYVWSYEKGRMEDWAIAQAREFIGEAELLGFDEAALQSGMEKYSIGPLPVNFGNEDLFTSLSYFSIPSLSSSEFSDMASNQNFWRVAFSTRLNTPSEPLVQGSKVLVLLPTEQIQAEADSIENIVSMYSSYWVHYKTEQTLNTFFMSNAKMEDNFWDTYFNLFMSGN
ncbi:MAG: SurA N-terminal domain-containing protein [Treponema sp.]|nr:SurA N-terminal domain-containing protein [Treponema sp.]